MKILSAAVALIFLSMLTMWLFAKQKANNFSQPRLNDGIFVDAPDEWKWSRDGIQLDHFKLLAGDPKVVDPKTGIGGTLQTVRYESGVIGAQHVFLFDSDGFLVSREWYVGMKDAVGVPAPKPTTPNNLKISYPRCVPMSWEGESDLGYHVEAQILHPSKGWNLSSNYYTWNTKSIHQHTGANEGRWRVRAISKNGAGVWSDFVNFSCQN